ATAEMPVAIAALVVSKPSAVTMITASRKCGIASLAFLGYGDPPPASDWGLLISIGKDYLKWPWLVYAPAFVTIGTVLSLNRISRWLRQTD
ncbi:MAG: hypothetical protein E6605_11865, partial [Bradyrhizobium sp.]|nr:hypothetical protein [Bradyrhizobium sp.]